MAESWGHPKTKKGIEIHLLETRTGNADGVTVFPGELLFASLNK